VLFLVVLFAVTTGSYAGFERPILAARPHYRTRRQVALEAVSAAAPADRR
jgi:hypothetical protein